MKTLAYQLVERLWKEVQPFQDRQSSYDFPTVLYDAAKFGNAEFLTILISSYPDIIWIADNQNRSLFHIAVLNQQESVFNLIYETAEAKEIILTYVDDKNKNILHLARYLAPSSRLNIVSGAALQMQQELLWFKVGVFSISISFFWLHLSIYIWKTVGDSKDWAAFIPEHEEFWANTRGFIYKET